MSINLLVVGKGDAPYSDRNRQRLVEYAQKAGCRSGVTC